MRGSYTTVFLRHVFELDAGNMPETLQLLVDFDDGFAARVARAFVNLVVGDVREQSGVR